MELPARFVRDYLDAARECGVEPESVLAGLPVLREQLDTPRGRVHWDDFAELSDRIAAALPGGARIEDVGRISVALSSSWAFRTLVPQLVTPALLLRVGFQFSGPALFPILRHQIEDLGDGALRLTLSVPAPYRGSESFFRACIGGIRSIPTLLGYQPALVGVTSLGPRGCVFEITPPPSRTIFGRVRSALRALRGESPLFDEVARRHEAIQEVFGALLRTQRELHHLMERIPDPLLVQRDGVIVWTNQALVTALECASLDDVRGRSVLDFIHPDDKESAASRLATPIAAARAGTFRLRVTDGSYRTFEIGEPQEVIYDEAPARMAHCRDVTERDALREQLVLADRMSQLGFLAAGVAHEINNPLAYALAALDLASRNLRAGRLETAAESLAIAREGAERVRGITNDLRMFTRGGEQRAEPVDLARVIRATADLAAANVRTRGRLVLDMHPVPLVFGDAGRLGQVVMNLLVNAIDAIAGGDPATSRIDVRAWTDADGRAVVEVEDNGHGIPKDAETRIFDPFFTTKPPRAGSGLGLSICQHIVTDLGGQITLGTPCGSGALFRVVLPPHDGPIASPETGPRSVERLRVLVIDDERALALAVGRMLEEEHQVEVVTSGEDALHRLEADTEYDVILCDLMMAGVGGMELYTKLVEDRPALARRFVFMTGGAFSADAQKFLSEVKNPCLDKPFTREEVLVALIEVRHAG